MFCTHDRMTRVKLIRLGSGAGFCVLDDRGRTLVYIYGKVDPTTAEAGSYLPMDEAEKVAKVIARALSVSDE